MRLLPLFCILLLLSSAQAEDIMFFADDYYKSLGRPALAASAVNPVLLPGEGVLQINLANLGRLEELMPIEQSGPAQDILLEMKEEMRGGHALAVNAALIGSGGIAVPSGPERIDDIAPGDNAILDYNVTGMKNASGWSRLYLEISYQQQADVSVKSGEVFPLYEATKDNLSLDVFVAGEGQPLSILGSSLSRNLFRGHSLKAIISNDGPDDLHNCSARLLAPSPFSAMGPEEALGDLPAGSLALADFNLRIDGEAKQQDYQMSSRICCQERCSSLPLTVSWQPGLLQGWALPALTIIGLAAIFMGRRYLLGRDKRRRSVRRN